MYVGEKRALEITIHDHLNQPYPPSAAVVEIFDSIGEIIDTQNCMIDENKIYVYIGTKVTGNPGEYEILWSIRRYMYKFKHKTDLLVLEL
jgi:hypothetical protein